MKARRGAAALMAAAAVAAPTAHASMRGTATGGEGQLPLKLPKPRIMPTFVIDPSFNDGGAEVDLSTRVVRSRTRVGPFDRAHETFHVLDEDEMNPADRLAITRIIAPRRVAEAATKWEGGVTGARPDLGELAADYYAAAATGQTLRPVKRHGMRVDNREFSYSPQMRAGRLAKFRRFLDDWESRRPLQAPAP